MSTTENSLPPDDMPVTPNSEPSQTDSVLKVPPRHQASTGEIAGNPEGSNEAPHSTISPRQARQRLNVPMPNMEVLAIDDALGIQTEIDKARDKFLDLVESLKTGRYLTDKIQGVEKHSGLGEPRAVIFHGDYKVIIMASMIVDLPKDLRGQDPYEVYHYLLTKRLGSEIDYVVKGIDRNNSSDLGNGEVSYGYAVKGVEFTYLRVGDIIQYTGSANDGAADNHIEILYGIDKAVGADLLTALGLENGADRYPNADHLDNAKYYYQSDVLIDALAQALQNNSTTVKNALETYVANNGGTAMPLTDAYGKSQANNLDHGTDSKTLDIGVGHLLGSSLPVGGKGTHTVLTGHSGMATQKMFSDLDKLKLGDVFYLQVLDETLAYQVDAIHTVLPYDTSFLGITEGEDYCTLVTCTPFGINTHRLLVRGTRIPYEEAEVIIAEKLQVEDAPASTWEQQYIKGILLGIATVAVILVFCIWGSHCQKRRRRRKTRQREQFRPRKRGKYEKA